MAHLVNLGARQRTVALFLERPGVGPRLRLVGCFMRGGARIYRAARATEVGGDLEHLGAQVLRILEAPLVGGPILGQDGKEVLKKDEAADDKFMGGINFYVKGVEGKVPAGK